MSKHPLYGLLYIVLFPFALLFGLSVITSFIAAFQSPILLFSVLLCAAAVVYTLTTFDFYSKAVGRGRQCKAVLRIWIRVSAFLCILLSLIFIIEGLVLALEPGILKPALDQVYEQQQLAMPKEQLMEIVKYLSYVILGYGLVLLVHLIYTFVLLSKYRNYFGVEHTNLDSFGQDV